MKSHEVGSTGRYNATGGNHAAKVVRDRSGRVHVIWLDAGRSGKNPAAVYRSGVQDPVTGRFAWDTPGIPISLSRSAKRALDANRSHDALSTWFPSAAPRLYRQADGRLWLDVLSTADPPERHGSPGDIIYQRHELSAR